VIATGLVVRARKGILRSTSERRTAGCLTKQKLGLG